MLSSASLDELPTVELFQACGRRYGEAEVSILVLTETATIKLDAGKVSTGEETEGCQEQQWVEMRIGGENPVRSEGDVKLCILCE